VISISITMNITNTLQFEFSISLPFMHLFLHHQVFSPFYLSNSPSVIDFTMHSQSELNSRASSCECMLAYVQAYFQAYSSFIFASLHLCIFAFRSYFNSHVSHSYQVPKSYKIYSAMTRNIL